MADPSKAGIARSANRVQPALNSEAYDLTVSRGRALQLSLEEARRRSWAAWSAWFASGVVCGSGFTFQHGWPAVILLAATVPLAIYTLGQIHRHYDDGSLERRIREAGS
jgi:hypothetical protein